MFGIVMMSLSRKRQSQVIIVKRGFGFWEGRVQANENNKKPGRLLAVVNEG